MSSRNVTINPEQRLFVIPAGNGFTCAGFDNIYFESYQLAMVMKLDEAEYPREEEIGTLAQFEQNRELIRRFADHPASKQTWFKPGTELRVQQILESARVSGSRLRLFMGDTETGRDWLSRFDVVGEIGRSTGIFKVPLLIPNNRSSGGTALLTDCILKIVDCRSGVTLYRHPKYQAPSIAVQPVSGELSPEWTHQAVVNDEVVARFKSENSANRWKSFMTGARMAP